MTSGPDDLTIVARILDGDVRSFETLIERHQSHVARIVNTKVPRDAAEELVHETFVRAYQSLATFSAQSPFEHWLSRIALRSCFDYWRRRYRRREVPVSSLSEDCSAWIDAVRAGESSRQFEEQTARAEARELLDWALARLSAVDRMVLTLTYLEEYTTAEAADLLGLSQANVKVRALRARAKLRKIIGPEMTDQGATHE